MGRPFTTWHIESYLTNFGLHVSILTAANSKRLKVDKASNTAEERRTVVAAFNDPDNPQGSRLRVASEKRAVD